MTDYYTDYNVTVTANTAIMDSNYISKYNIENISILYIYVTPEDVGVLSIVRTKDGSDYVEMLNSGNELVAGCGYLFSILISNDEINIKYSQNTTFKYLQIREVL